MDMTKDIVLAQESKWLEQFKARVEGIVNKHNDGEVDVAQKVEKEESEEFIGILEDGLQIEDMFDGILTSESETKAGKFKNFIGHRSEEVTPKNKVFREILADYIFSQKFRNHVLEIQGNGKEVKNGEALSNLEGFIDDEASDLRIEYSNREKFYKAVHDMAVREDFRFINQIVQTAYEDVVSANTWNFKEESFSVDSEESKKAIFDLVWKVADQKADDLTLEEAKAATKVQAALRGLSVRKTTGAFTKDGVVGKWLMGDDYSQPQEVDKYIAIIPSKKLENAFGELLRIHEVVKNSAPKNEPVGETGDAIGLDDIDIDDVGELEEEVYKELCSELPGLQSFLDRVKAFQNTQRDRYKISTAETNNLPNTALEIANLIRKQFGLKVASNLTVENLQQHKKTGSNKSDEGDTRSQESDGDTRSEMSDEGDTNSEVSDDDRSQASDGDTRSEMSDESDTNSEVSDDDRSQASDGDTHSEISDEEDNDSLASGKIPPATRHGKRQVRWANPLVAGGVTPNPAPGTTIPSASGAKSPKTPGGTPPVPGTTTPAPGTTTPVPGTTTPAPGTTTPAPGTTTPTSTTTNVVNNNIIDLTEVRKRTAAGLLSDIMVPSLVGGDSGNGNFAIKDYGLAIPQYDGAEIINYYGQLNSAYAAWSAKGEKHDGKTRYRSMSGSEQESLVTVSYITNDLTGKPDGYVMTTVDKNGVAQLFITPAAFDRQINQPLSEAHNEMVDVVKDAIAEGRIPNFRKVLGSADENLYSDIHQKYQKQQGYRKEAEAKADKVLHARYSGFIDEVVDGDEKKRLSELLKNNDYKELVKSLEENGELKISLFAPEKQDALSKAWTSLKMERDSYSEINKVLKELSKELKLGWEERIDNRDYKGLFYEIYKLSKNEDLTETGLTETEKGTLQRFRSKLIDKLSSMEGVVTYKYDSEPEKEFAQVLCNNLISNIEAESLRESLTEALTKGHDEFFNLAKKEGLIDDKHPLRIANENLLRSDKKDAAKVTLEQINEIRFAHVEEINKWPASLVEKFEHYFDSNFPIVLKVLQEEHQRLDDKIKADNSAVRAVAEQDFVRAQYQKIVNLMDETPRPTQEQVKLGLEGADRDKNLDTLFAQHECIFKDLTEAKKQYAEFNAITTATPNGDELKKDICNKIIGMVNLDRPSKVEVQKLLNDGGDVYSALFGADKKPKHQGLFVSTKEAEAVKNAEDSKNDLLKQQHVAGYIRSNPDIAKRDGLKSAIDEIERCQTRMEKDGVNLLVKEQLNKIVTDAIKQNNLSDRIVGEIAGKASAVYNDGFMQQNVRDANQTNKKEVLNQKQKKEFREDYPELQGGVLNLKFAPSNFNSTSILKTSQYQHSVMFNGDFSEGGGGFPQDIGYIPVPKHQNVFARTVVCTHDNMTPLKDGNGKEVKDENGKTIYQREVFKNGIITHERHNIGDVVMDHNTIFYLTELKRNGQVVIDPKTGKPQHHYQEVNLGSDLEIGGRELAKSVNFLAKTLVRTASLGVLNKSKLIDSELDGEKIFGSETFASIRASYKNMEILAGSSGVGGKKSYAVLSNGKVFQKSFSAEKGATTSTVENPRPPVVAAATPPSPPAPPAGGTDPKKKIKFTFGKDGKLKEQPDGYSAGSIEHGGQIYLAQSTYPSLEYCGRSKDAEVTKLIKGLKLASRVAMVTGSENGELTGLKGDVIVDQNIYYLGKDGSGSEVHLPVFTTDTPRMPTTAFKELMKDKSPEMYKDIVGQLEGICNDSYRKVFTVSVEIEKLNRAQTVKKDNGTWKVASEAFNKGECSYAENCSVEKQTQKYSSKNPYDHDAKKLKRRLFQVDALELLGSSKTEKDKQDILQKVDRTIDGKPSMAFKALGCIAQTATAAQAMFSRENNSAVRG